MRTVDGGWVLALGIAIALYVVHLAWLAAGGPLGAYPIVHPDSLDWLTNGLRLAGVPVECTWRPPVTPLVFAGLFRAHLEWVIPLSVGRRSRSRRSLWPWGTGHAVPSPRRSRPFSSGRRSALP